MRRVSESLLAAGGLLALLRLAGLDFFARPDVMLLGVALSMIGILSHCLPQRHG